MSEIEVPVSYAAVVAALRQVIMWLLAGTVYNFSAAAAAAADVCFLSSFQAIDHTLWHRSCLRRLMTLVVGVVLVRNRSVTERGAVCRLGGRLGFGDSTVRSHSRVEVANVTLVQQQRTSSRLNTKLIWQCCPVQTAKVLDTLILKILTAKSCSFSILTSK